MKKICKLIDTLNFKLNSAVNKNVTSKDTRRDSSFSIELIVFIEVIENDKIIKKAKIKKNTNYNNLDSQFELKRYENILIKRSNRSNYLRFKQFSKNIIMIIKFFEITKSMIPKIIIYFYFMVKMRD